VKIMSIVRARIDPGRVDLIRMPYEAALAAGLPPAIVETSLLADESGDVAIATVWRDRATLDAMLATGEEPFARRLLREAGGEPRAEFFDILATSTDAHGPTT
jgi:hypothetical protein